ncbi:MAG: hypothetical protein AB1410_09435 [Acidobacteriota bacterium]
MEFQKDLYKSSQFNEYLGKGKEGGLIYNNYTGAMIEVSKNIYEAILNNRINNLSHSNIITALKHGKFILQKDENESIF